MKSSIPSVLLLVDGYNMIWAWSELSKLAENRLEEARDRLLHMLADYQAYSGEKVIAVFDSYRVPGAGTTYKQENMTIYFTKEKETADECIERLVKKCVHSFSQIYVATSDLTEQCVIFGQGALRISAKELQNNLKRARQKVQWHIQQMASYPMKRNPVEGMLTSEQLVKLERVRRGEKE